MPSSWRWRWRGQLCGDPPSDPRSVSSAATRGRSEAVARAVLGGAGPIARRALRAIEVTVAAGAGHRAVGHATTGHGTATTKAGDVAVRFAITDVAAIAPLTGGIAIGALLALEVAGAARTVLAAGACGAGIRGRIVPARGRKESSYDEQDASEALHGHPGHWHRWSNREANGQVSEEKRIRRAPAHRALPWMSAPVQGWNSSSVGQPTRTSHGQVGRFRSNLRVLKRLRSGMYVLVRVLL